MRKRVVRRESDIRPDASASLLERLFAARGVASPKDLDHALAGLHPPQLLLNADIAGELLANAVKKRERILIVGDFDADGATSCALMVAVLRAMGADVDYLVPDRFRFGYGLTPEIVDVATRFSPRLIVTVDNGIASNDGVDRAVALGIDVVVTDHHLPGTTLPNAAAIVNPNQSGCTFPSKSLAGVGVAFYVLSVVRSVLQSAGWFDDRPCPNLADSLDLVALGTIADVVPLDQNNRRLVQEGVRRIRAGRCRPGITALLSVAGVDPQFLTTRDLAFSVAPRLNAAGRLQDMSIGIECLLAEGERALTLAEQLSELNEERKSIEQDMRDQALQELASLSIEGDTSAGLCLYKPGWHQGVVGILASRIKEKSHRPVIAFARVAEGELKGSGRSVSGFHMRDALDAIATRHPGLLSRFGGHAMAAGLSLAEADLARFSAAFNDRVREVLGEASIEQVIVTDGDLAEPITTALARTLENAAPWGQGFPEPEFDGRFEVLEQRILGGRHLKLLLQPEMGEPVDAICFNHGYLVETRAIRCTYRVEVNRYRGRETPQLMVSVIL